jgi:hypothetical protein
MNPVKTVTYTLKWSMVLPAFVLLLAGCGSKHKGDDRPRPSVPASLQVENRNWLDVTIYVVHDGQRSRLGSATAAKTTDFTIRPSQLGQLGAIQLVADPVGSPGAIASPRVVVKPGARLVWTLATDLSRSSLAVY